MKMRRYRKKSTVIIQAHQMLHPFTVDTLEGKMQGKAGDYLVTGVKGEQYPCAKEIFEETYEEVKK